MPALAPAPAWPDLLDALEERNRRCAAVLAGAEGPVPDVPLAAAGPVPHDQVARARLVLARTAELEALVAARAAVVQRGMRYRQA